MDAQYTKNQAWKSDKDTLGNRVLVSFPEICSIHLHRYILPNSQNQVGGKKLSRKNNEKKFSFLFKVKKGKKRKNKEERGGKRRKEKTRERNTRYRVKKLITEWNIYPGSFL